MAKGDIPCRYLLSYSPGGSTRRDVGPGVHMGPPFSRREVMGSAMVPFERAMVVSYRLSIVTIALPLTIWPQFAIECLQRSNQQRVDHFGAKVGEEGADRSRETRGCRMQKMCRYLLPFEYDAETCQTGRQTNYKHTKRQTSVTSIAVGEIA